MSLAAISALLLVCLVHRGEVSSAPCGEDLGVSLAASLGSRGGSSFPFFLKATTAPVSASRPVSIHCCQSRSVLSKKQESTKETPVSDCNGSWYPLLPTHAGPFSTSPPNPHLAGHGKRKDHPLAGLEPHIPDTPMGSFSSLASRYGGLHFSVVKTGLTSETGFVSCEKKPANKCGHVDNTNHQQIQRQEQIPKERNSN